MLALLVAFAPASTPLTVSLGERVLHFDASQLAAGPLTDISGALRFAGDGCVALSKATTPNIVFARTGGCTIADKAHAAAQAGATALVVADTLESAYINASSAQSIVLSDPCLVDCSKGRASLAVADVGVADILAGLPDMCSTPPDDAKSYATPCPTPFCALSGAPDGAPEREICCVMPRSDATDGAGSAPLRPNASLPVRTLALSLPLASALLGECAAARCEMAIGEETPPPALWDGSSAIVWLLATGTAAVGAYLAAAGANNGDAAGGEGAAGADGEFVPASANLDASSSVGFLAFASVGLVGAYFLLKALHITNLVMFGINLAFMLGAAQSSTQLLFTPLATRLMRRGDSPATLGTALGFGAAAVWYLFRRAPWMWLVQDGLSACLCVVFVQVLRVPTLAIAAFFLGLMFCCARHRHRPPRAPRPRPLRSAVPAPGGLWLGCPARAPRAPRHALL